MITIDLSPRLEKIVGEIPECEVLADIGCDHGYAAAAALETGKCKKVVVADVSAKCLQKAEKLLSEYYPDRFESVVSNGFEKIRGVDCALIAGMGGELIVDIITRAVELPEFLVLQPMKNSEKVRECLIKSGYKVLRDYTFKDVKYYDILVAQKGIDRGYTERQLIYGRDNLIERGADFLECIAKRRDELIEAKSKAGQAAERALDTRITEYSEILNEL